MTWRLLVSPTFYNDLEAIESYLTEQASAEVARRQVDRIMAKLRIIAENPLAYAQRANLGTHSGSRLSIPTS